MAKVFKLYPDLKCFLTHKTEYELIAGVILSAQCTDDRVNLVTPHLYKAFPDFESMAKAKQKAVEKIIYSTGFYHNKSKHLITMSKRVLNKFEGKLPSSIAELITLQGVSRKTANVVQQEIFGLTDGIVVDTHVKRLAFRMGLTKEKSPEKVEIDLMKVLPHFDWRQVSLALITHGRKYCMARNPNCIECPVKKLCPRKGLEAK